VLDGNPCCNLRPRRHSELVEDTLQMIFGGARSNDEALCDLFVGEALGDERRDFSFAWAEGGVPRAV